MDRERAIQIINTLYPPDSKFPECAEIGNRLLAQAKYDCASWRNEPIDVLVRFAELCEAEEARATGESTEKGK